jgi:hypothetical protein
VPVEDAGAWFDDEARHGERAKVGRIVLNAGGQTLRPCAPYG